MAEIRPKLVWVVWEDAASLDEGPWNYEPEHKYVPRLFEQVGFLLCDDPGGIVLAHTWGDDGVTAIRDQIPRGMIRQLVELKAPKRKPT